MADSTKELAVALRAVLEGHGRSNAQTVVELAKRVSCWADHYPQLASAANSLNRAALAFQQHHNPTQFALVQHRAYEVLPLVLAIGDAELHHCFARRNKKPCGALLNADGTCPQAKTHSYH